MRLEGLGPFAHGLAVEHGASLSVLAAVGGDTSPISPRQDYSSLGSIRGKDQRSTRYLARRYDPELPLARQPGTPWNSIAGLRNVVVHEYFRVNPDLIRDILDNQLTPLLDEIS